VNSHAGRGPPTVSLTAPTTGNLYLAPATFAVKANASASGVGINRVANAASDDRPELNGISQWVAF